MRYSHGFATTTFLFLLMCFAAVPGVAEDITDSLQAAIDGGEGLVEVPPGEHRLSRTLRVELSKHGRAVIRGSGASRLVMAAAGPAIEIVGTHDGTAAPHSVRPDVWERENGPRVENLEIVGEHDEADGVRLSGTMQPTLRGLVIRRTRHAIHLTERNRNVTISDCHVYENRGAGIFYDDVNLHQSNITACHISYNPAGGVVIRGGDVRNVHITGCDIEGNMGGPDAPPAANVLLDSRGGSIGEVAITGCTIQHAHESPGSANIRVDGHSHAVSHTDERRHGNITISGNVLSDTEINIHLRNTRGVAVTGNTVWKGFQHNVLVEDSEAVMLSGNVFDRNPRYHYGDGATANLGLRFVDSRGCSLSGNVINGAGEGRAPLWFEDCREMLVAGGSIRGFDAVAVLWQRVRDSQLSGCLMRSRDGGEPSEAVRDEEGRNNVIEWGERTTEDTESHGGDTGEADGK